MEGAATGHVLFGLDPLWVSTALLIVTYATIMTEKLNRAIVALIGAGLMISLGILNQEQAVEGIDFNTLALLTGMMLIVAVARRSGIFQYVAIVSGWSIVPSKAIAGAKLLSAPGQKNVLGSGMLFVFALPEATSTSAARPAGQTQPGQPR